MALHRLARQPFRGGSLNEAGQQGLIDIDTYPGVGGRFTPGGIADNGKVVGSFYWLHQVATFSLTERLRISGPGNMTVSAVNKRAWAVGRGSVPDPSSTFMGKACAH